MMTTRRSLLAACASASLAIYLFVDTREAEGGSHCSAEGRVAFTQFVDRRAEAALDERGLRAVAELRDRVLVYLLAYSGAGRTTTTPNTWPANSHLSM